MSKIPLTWALIFINIFMFVIFSGQNLIFKSELTEILEDKYFYQTQARLFKNYVANHPESYGYFIKAITSFKLDNDIKSNVVSSFALSDRRFINNILLEAKVGDAIAYKSWKENFIKLTTMQKATPNYTLGILKDSSVLNFISYQFMHASFGHLFSNMLFLLLFGALIEPLLGGLLLLVTYLSSGVVAAQVFLLFSEGVNSPLIGASGSISGLMALYCLAAYKKNIRFFYFLFIPKPEYMGYVFLPSWLLFLYWCASDLAGYLSQVSEHTGVAYIAHMGGQLAGGIVAMTLLMLWKLLKTKTIVANEAIGKTVPLTTLIRQRTASGSSFDHTAHLHK